MAKKNTPQINVIFDDTTEVKPTFFKHRPDDAGYDLTAVRMEVEHEQYKQGDKVLSRATKVKYYTGIRLKMPINFEAQLRCRSSIHKYDLRLANSVGTIDASYDGEIIVIFKVTSDKKYLKLYNVGDKIAQVVFHELPEIELRKQNYVNGEVDYTQTPEYDFVSTTAPARGENGFGSTDNLK